MDNNVASSPERWNNHQVNGSAKNGNKGPAFVMGTSQVGTPGSGSGRPTSLATDSSPVTNVPSGTFQLLSVVVNRDNNGYGMKVSGDNPVFVQSVKSGGAAEKAGLHAGDRILEVNGTNVISSTHTEVVALIKASTKVELKVQHKTGGGKTPVSAGGGIMQHHGRSLSGNSSRITGPQPVTSEKQYQLQREKEQQYKLMIERERRYMDLLRSDLAVAPDEKKQQDYEKTVKNLQQLYSLLEACNSLSPGFAVTPTTETKADTACNNNTTMLSSHKRRDNNNSASTPTSDECCSGSSSSSSGTGVGGTAAIGAIGGESTPPRLPKRNRKVHSNSSPSTSSSSSTPRRFVDHDHEDNNNSNNGNSNNAQLMAATTTTTTDNGTGLMAKVANAARDRCSSFGGGSRKAKHFKKSLSETHHRKRPPEDDAGVPPPLPPRNPLPVGRQDASSNEDAVNSLNKQLAYPLVATCATLIDNCHTSGQHTHQRTKSSPESLMNNLSPAEASQRLIFSESMNDLRCNNEQSFEDAATPPGTPPPPYLPTNSNRNSTNNEDNSLEWTTDVSSPEVSPLRTNYPGISSSSMLANSPIAATPLAAQQPIISMEDDEISESDLSQLEDHGPFKSLSQLWHKDNMPYLVVFLNFVVLNCDPESLLFYLITDLYKEGNTKEMRKWAYEIHSCFLVPGGPLRIANVDESIAHEIDQVLLKEQEGEDLLRRIFWKARAKAKEEITRQLDDFQQVRVSGLGTMYGPQDSQLKALCMDRKSGEDGKLYESIFAEILSNYVDPETISKDPKKYYTAAALHTVGTRIFGVRPASCIDGYPTFVNREKSFRSKIMGRPTRKLNVQGHQFVAQQYYTVIRCYLCHLIIFGISPQGYECSACHINLHRTCVNLYDDSCPGPVNPNKKKVMKLMDRIRYDKMDQKRKNSANFIQMEKDRRLAEERENSNVIDLDNDNNTSKSSNQLSRTPSDKRPEVTREDGSKNVHQDSFHSFKSASQSFHEGGDNDGSKCETSTSLPISASSGSGANPRRQHTNINRSESVKEPSEKNRKQKRNVSDPLRSTNETVDLESQSTFKQHSGSSSNSSLSSRSSEYPNSNNLDPVLDSDLDIDSYPSDWTAGLSEEQLAQIDPTEKQRQDVINELFHTERSHVRNLKVMDLIFRKSLIDSKQLTDQEINLVFANLTELLSIHNQFNAAMKSKRKENPVVSGIGDLLLGMFDGEMGAEFCEGAANFCKKQQQALEFLTDKRKRDSKFEAVLINCEKHTLCRRLPLQGFLPQEMQRLSKYPLLIERLISAEEKAERKVASSGKEQSPECSRELEKLRSALEKSKEILNRVNEVAKIEYNRNRLEEIKNHLDVIAPSRTDGSLNSFNEIKNIDLTNYTLVHEGTLTLKRREPKNPIPVQLLLLEESVILLHKEGERFTLKCFNDGNHQLLFPLIKLSNLICRENAAELTTLFLVNTSQLTPTKYEIQCRDVCERRTWYKYLSDATEPYKRDVKAKQRIERYNRDHMEEESIHELSSNGNVNNSSRIDGQPYNEGGEQSSLNGDSSSRQASANDETGGTGEKTQFPDATTKDESIVPSVSGDGLSIKLAANDWPLIQPSEVQVSDTLAHSAESCLTPLEKIRRKDEEVKRALADKETLVADLLNIPREDYHLIADMASNEALSDPSEGEPSELVLAAVYQVDQLIAAVNDSLNISETDTVLASGGKNASCNSNEHHFTNTNTNNVPSVPVAKLKQIATNLTSQLTILLNLAKQREEERNKLRREVQRLRELQHEKHHLHSPSPNRSTNNNNVNESVSDSALSGDLESIEESPKETETT